MCKIAILGYILSGKYLTRDMIILTDPSVFNDDL